eukprot:scaffold5138_cov74-Skeletonema_menzelii.AAC.1
MSDINITMDDWDTLLAIFYENVNPEFEEDVIPPNFRTSLLPGYNRFEFSDISELTFRLTNSPNSQQVFNFLNENPRISVLTIATGFINEMELLHNFNSLEVNESTKHFAFSGLGTSANVLELILSRLIHTTTAKVPSFSTLRDPHNLSQISTIQFEDNELVTTEVPNAIVLTPNIAEILTVGQTLTNDPSEALAKIASYLVAENARWKEIHESNCTEEDGSLDLTNHQEYGDEPIKSAMPLLQTLYAWSKQKSPRSISFRPSQNPSALELLSTATSLFLPGNTTTTSEAQARPTPAPPTGPNPFISTNSAPDDNVIANIVNAFSSTQTLQTTAINKLSHSLGDFANATASSIEGKRKIGKQIKSFLLNAMTHDGETPATELTESMSDVLKSSTAEIQLTVSIILNKHNANASPTPDLIKALKLGKLWHEPGQPEGMCIFNLPQSLNNTPFENIDVIRLEEEQKFGQTLTDSEREALYSKHISVSRTINHLLAKARSLLAIFTELLGPNIPVTEEAENWVAFISDNLYTLQMRQRSFDPSLPARLESIFDAQINEFFCSARYGVPDLKVLDGNDLRQSLLRGIIKPDIPKAIEEALNPPTKPKNDDRKRKGDDPAGADKRAPFSTVNHNNQPRELQMSTEKFRLVIQNSISKRLVTAPMCPSKDCSECCKFIFLGQCNSKCPRTAAHTSPAGNKARMDTLRKFIQDCLLAYKENKKPSDPDFH